MPKYICTNNTTKEITEQYIVKNNILQEIADEYINVGNSNKLIFESRNYSATLWTINGNTYSYNNPSILNGYNDSYADLPISIDIVSNFLIKANDIITVQMGVGIYLDTIEDTAGIELSVYSNKTYINSLSYDSFLNHSSDVNPNDSQTYYDKFSDTFTVDKNIEKGILKLHLYMEKPGYYEVPYSHRQWVTNLSILINNKYVLDI